MSNTPHLSSPPPQTLYQRLVQRVKPYTWAIVLASLLNFGVAATHIYMTDLVQSLFDHGFGPQRDTRYVWMVPIFVIGLFLVRGICIFCSSYIMTWVANGVLLRLRADMYTRLLHFPDSHFKTSDPSALLNKFTVDAGNFSLVAAEVITTTIRESLVILALLGYLIYLAPALTAMMLILIPLAALITRYFAKRLRAINLQNISINADLTQSVKESIHGQRVVKVFNAYAPQLQRFSSINQRLRRTAIRNAVSSAAVSPITQFIASIIISMVVAIALILSDTNGMTVGTFTSFILAIIQILDPLKRLSNMTGSTQRMMAAAQSVFELLDTPVENNTGTARLQSPVQGRIQLDKVCFQYPNDNRLALKEVSLQVEAGQTVALVGRSGSGKSTLLSLIPRFIELQSGTISVDGQSIQALELHHLREHIAVVSQETILFDDTIAANVAFGCSEFPLHGSLSKDLIQRIERALALAHLDDYIRQLPEGIYTMIGDNGSLLSGGQRQRLAIARAIMKDAPILILDEATSALDNESERLVQASLEQLMQGRTTFMIAHRLSTILHADTILVMDQGEIVEQGPHAELLARNGIYAKLYALQYEKSPV